MAILSKLGRKLEVSLHLGEQKETPLLNYVLRL